MKKIRLIYNKSAGQNKGSEMISEVIGRLSENGFEVTAFRASRENSAEPFIAATPKDTYGIVVAGGDGTINKVVNFMKKHNIDVPLGIIPAGTSNDFALHLGIYGDIDKAIQRIIDGNVEGVDVGKVNDTYFVNILAAGMFSGTSHKTDKRLKEVLGHASYFITAAREPFEQKPFKIRIETEDGIVEENIVVIMIFNGSSVGRIDLFSDNSSVQDGLLDIVMLRKGKVSETLKILSEFGDGKFVDNDNVAYIKEKKFKISLIEGSCTTTDADGDLGPQLPFDVECVEKGINMFM